jgi:hypothetical protein
MLNRLKLANKFVGLAYRLLATSVMTGMLIAGTRDYIKHRGRKF